MSWDLYETIERHALAQQRVERILLGLNWSVCGLEHGTGLCFSPSAVPRTLAWPGSLHGRSADSLVPWLRSFEPAEAAIGLCVANAALNRSDNALLARAEQLATAAPGHLRVFAHFAPLLRGANVVVIGLYPGLDALWADLPYQCIERRHLPGTVPDTAAEYVLPHADWVFITGSAIANKTAPRLLELCHRATVVMMGPSVPWLDELRRFGVDYLAGVVVRDPELAFRVAAEGGGTRMFDEAVEYRLAAL